jgi:site-specific DNA recombinase
MATTHFSTTSQRAYARLQMQRKAESGVFPGCPPVGYLSERIGSTTRIVLDHRQVGNIQRTFELADRKDYSLRKMLEIVTAKGLRSRNGKVLGSSALWGILTNPFYTGMLRYDGKLSMGTHQALVSKQRFERIQEKLLKRRRNSGYVTCISANL